MKSSWQNWGLKSGKYPKKYNSFSAGNKKSLRHYLFRKWHIMKIIYTICLLLIFLTAGAQNNKPVIKGPGNFFALFGQTACADFTTSDADGDTVIIWWDNMLPKATFSSNSKQVKFATGSVCCTPLRSTHNPTLPYAFYVYATDGKDTASKTVTFVVPDFPENVHPVVTKVSGDIFEVDVLGDSAVPWDNYQNLRYESKIKDTSGNTVFFSQQRNFSFTATSKQKFRLYTVYKTDIALLTTVDTLQVDFLTRISKTESNISVYPNPASRFITISCNFHPGDIITITGISGKTLVCLEPSGNRQDIDLEKITPGIYFITVKNKAGEIIAVQKLLKQ